jgi:hypothetical protein
LRGDHGYRAPRCMGPLGTYYGPMLP